VESFDEGCEKMGEMTSSRVWKEDFGEKLGLKRQSEWCFQFGALRWESLSGQEESQFEDCEKKREEKRLLCFGWKKREAMKNSIVENSKCLQASNHHQRQQSDEKDLKDDFQQGCFLVEVETVDSCFRFHLQDQSSTRMCRENH
jgi:hypothetical protein